MDAEFVGRIIGAVLCVVTSAFFSGLTLGVLGLDTNELKILIASGTTEEKKQAQLILPIRERGNLMLCTMVLGNVAATSLSSILLSDMTDGLTGFLVSTIVIVVFGEIVPQTICNRNGLYIGAKMVPLVYVVGFLLLPLTYPLAWTLDTLMGEEAGMTFDRRKLRELVAMQVQNAGIDASEGARVSAALHLSEKKTRDVMTPQEEIFSLSASDKLDHALMKLIFEKGYSRIPVMGGPDGATCLGLLYAKDLVLVHPEQCHPVVYVTTLFNRTAVEVVDAEDSLEHVLKVFTRTKQHFALVRDVVVHADGRDNTWARVGLVTMEDILEFLLAQEIEDEYDHAGGCSSTAPPLHAGSFQASQHPAPLSAPHALAMSAHLLANVPPFAGSAGAASRLTPQAVAAALQHCTLLTLQPGQACVARKDRLPHMLLLISGQLDVAAGEDALPCTVRPWEHLGERALTVPDYAADFGVAGGGGGESRVLCFPRTVYASLVEACSSGAGAAEAAAAVAAAAQAAAAAAAAAAQTTAAKPAAAAAAAAPWPASPARSHVSSITPGGLEDVDPARLLGAHHRRSTKSAAAVVASSGGGGPAAPSVSITVADGEGGGEKRAGESRG